MSFRTIDISDPRFEREGLRAMTFKSPSLRGRADLTLFLPDTSTANLPLVLLLHGVYGSHWAWTQKAGAHHTAARLIAEKIIPPMALAMPSDGLWGDGSAYLRHRGGDFERYIVEEIPALVRQIEPRIGNTLFISGLSMGGFGALRLGAKHCNIFSGISAHSAITHFSQMLPFVEEPPEGFGPIDDNEASALYWLEKNRSTLPPVRFDCGTSDDLLPENRKLHADLLTRKIEHIYQEFPGGHEWSYWETHLADSLRFFGGCINRSNP